MDSKFEIETEYLRVLELTRKANAMSQNITSDDVEFKPILRIPKTYLTRLDKMEETDQKEDIVGVLQRSLGSESETVMTLAEFEAKLEAIERMSTSSTDTVDTNISSMGDPFFSMQQHMLIGVASVPLNCIKSSTTAVEWDLPIVSPSGLKCGKLAVNLQLIYVNNDDQQDSVVNNDDDSCVDIKLGSQICLKIDVLHVNELPAFYGNFLFGQYDLFALLQPTIFYSEESHSTQLPYDDCSEISVQFNHCQVHVANVTEEVANIIDRGYFVIELWGHHGAGFLDQGSDDESKPGHNQNHVQLWVQVLEKFNEEIDDFQLALVEEDRLTNTGGIFVLAKARKKRLRVQLVSPSRRVRCMNMSLLGVTQFSKEPITNPHWGVQPYQNVMGTAWAQSFEQNEANTCARSIKRKTSQPQFLPSSIMQPKISRPKISRTPGGQKSIKQLKEETRIPFLERRMSYPEDNTFSIDDISQKLQPMKCKRHNEAIAEWNSFADVPASCTDSWFCDVIVKTTVQTSYSKTMEFILRKRICVKVLDDKQIDNYTSFITGYACRKIGTKCGALFDISPKDTKHITIDRRDSMAYIEVFKGENPDAVFKERLQHISKLHKQRLKSMNSFDNNMSDWDMPKIDEQDNEERKSNQSTPHKKLSRQGEIDHAILEEIAYEHEEQIEESKGDEDIFEMDDRDDAHDLNRNTSNNNFNSLAVGKRVIVQHEDRYLCGHVRFIGSVQFSNKEQIGIELDQPYGTLDGTVNGVSYFRCKADHGIFTTRDKIVFNPIQ